MKRKGLYLKGGNHLWGSASHFIRLNRNGKYEILNNKSGLIKEDMKTKVGSDCDKRLLLMM
jgi:hypothetical protein